jgi:hypothetical protein
MLVDEEEVEACIVEENSKPLIGVGDHCLILQGVCLGIPHCKVLAGLTPVWGKLILLHAL